MRQAFQLLIAQLYFIINFLRVTLPVVSFTHAGYSYTGEFICFWPFSGVSWSVTYFLFHAAEVPYTAPKINISLYIKIISKEKYLKNIKKI